MFGEGLGGRGLGYRDYAWTWFGVGGMITFWGLGRGQELPSEANFSGAAFYNFSSRHPATVQFCFADGSTRGLRFGRTNDISPESQADRTSDWSLLQQLAGRGDGLAYDTNPLVE
jgi:hypothetical protein